MTSLKSLVIVCLIGCSLAAPRPVDWDEWGRKIKNFGNQVRTKYHEVKEKVLPIARTACGVVNQIPSDDFTNFQPSNDFSNFQPGDDFSNFLPGQDVRNFRPERSFRSFGGGFPHHFQHTNSFHRGGFPHHPYFHHRPTHPFPGFNHPHRGYNPSFKPDFHPGFNRGFAPWSPTTSTSTSTTTSTTTENVIPNVDFNPSDSGLNPAGTDLNTDFSGFNSGSDSGLNPSSSGGTDIGFNPVGTDSNTGFSDSGLNPSSNDGSGISNGGTDNEFNPAGTDLDAGFSGSNSGSDSGLNPSSDDGFGAFDGALNPSNDGFNPSSGGFNPSNDGFNPVDPVVPTPSITNIDLSPSGGGFNPFDVGSKPSDDGFNPVGPEVVFTPSTAGSDFNPDDIFSNDVGGGNDLPPSGSFDPSRRSFKSGHSTPGTTIEQDDLNLGDEIPPFIPPGDDNGLDDSDDEKVTNDDQGKIEFRQFGNRFYK